jgi:phosphatidate cytidylyltransferase
MVPVVGLLALDDLANFDRPGLWLVPLGLLVGLPCVWELAGLFGRVTPGLDLRLVALVGVVMILLLCSPVLVPQWNPVLGTWGGIVLALTTGLVVLATMEMVRFRSAGNAAVRTAVSLFALALIGLPFAFVLNLRLLPLQPPRASLLAVASFVFVVKLADVGAYFAGRGYGQRRLAPGLSPNKTVEGAAGGFLAAVVAAMVFQLVIFPWVVGYPVGPATVPTVVAYGLSIAAAGLLGDLCVSMVKRDAGCKDSGDWLPGLGGLLDVTDSILWSAPVAYFWFAPWR